MLQKILNSKQLTAFIAWQKKPSVRYIALAIFAYVIFVFYYMGPSITHINSEVYGFGDNTAGPIWRNTFSPSSPLGGKVSVTNYPDGENIYSPVGYGALAQTVPIWVLSHIFSPVVAYNLFNIVGLLFTAIITYAFILKLTKNRWIAFFAGYAASFSGYYQVKIGGHPSYAFSGLFIATLWLFLSLINKPSFLRALPLGLLVGSTLYFDPYFVLYQGVALVGIFIGWVTLCLIKKIERERLLKTIKYMIVAVLFFTVTSLPIVGVYLRSRSTIEQQVASVRGNVLKEAEACSNYPHEYLLPFVLHPVAKTLGLENKVRAAEIKLKDNFSCGIGEDSVGLSLTLVALISVTGVVLIWEFLNKRKNPLRENNKILLVVLTALAFIVLGILFGLPPKSLFGIPTPTKLLLELTTTWRTLTRAFMIVNLGLVLLASVSLIYFYENKKLGLRFKQLMLAIIFLLVFIEYQVFTPFKGNGMSSFSFKNDVPAVYNYLKEQDEIGTIAEYPMESYGESDAPSYYLSMQLVHNKKTLNATSPTSSLEVFRRSIKNLDDPQTVPMLRSLGIDAVVLHGVEESDNAFLSRFKHSAIFEQPKFTLLSHSGVIQNDKSVIVWLNNEKTDKTPYPGGLLSTGFYRNLGIIKGPLSWAYEAVDGARIDIKEFEPLSDRNNSYPVNYCFMIRASAPGETINFEPLVDGIKLDLGPITNEYKQVNFKVKDQIEFHSKEGSNTQITKLGC